MMYTVKYYLSVNNLPNSLKFSGVHKDRCSAKKDAYNILSLFPDVDIVYVDAHNRYGFVKSSSFEIFRK